MRTKLFALLVIFLALAIGCTRDFLATAAVSKPTPRVYLPLVVKDGQTAWPVAGSLSDPATPSGAPPASPNLLPYAPENWAYPVQPSSSPDVSGNTNLFAGQGNSFTWAVLNEGNSAASGRVYTCLYLDGVEIGRWYADEPPKRSYVYVSNYNFPLYTIGNHTVKITADCTNVVSESNETDNNWQKMFFWQPQLIISQQQGFDACEAQTLSKMQTWWWKSPYYDYNIYYGGASRACAQPNLTPAWVQSVMAMGWRLIPTWVGPQAPCTNFFNRFSSNQTTAYNQGREQADLALTAAAALGLTGADKSNTVIYYDLEAYNTVDTTCQAAVQAFTRGWVTRIRESGSRAGMYSTASALSKMWVFTDKPDDIWAAYWKIPYQYDPNASVWNLPYLTNDMWKDHQRIHQYAGGHNESWGGVTINIDSNVADGRVVGVIPDPASPGAQSVSVQQVGVPILGMDMISPEEGWTLSATDLLWTIDGGMSWRDVTPGLAAGEELLTAYFLSPDAGWAVVAPLLSQSGGVNFQIHSTSDGGASWTASQLELGADPDASGSQQVYLHFTDPLNGWLVLQQISSSNFRPGRLFRTSDGGLTWQETNIPIGEPVLFLAPEIGFTAGGPAGDEFYRTADRGDTWTAQNVAQTLAPGEIPLYQLPQPQGGLNASLPVVIHSDSNPRLEVYATRDGGQSWVLQSTRPLIGDPYPAPVLPPDFENQATAQGTPAALPEGTTQVDFSDALHGWALASETSCSGQKGLEPVICTTQSQLWVTSDGGLTWTEQTPLT